MVNWNNDTINVLICSLRALLSLCWVQNLTGKRLIAFTTTRGG